jgi:hypothetical protein
MTLRLPWITVFVCSATMHSACGDEAAKPGLVEVHDLPSELRNIDIGYLPYEYATDGCQYRAPLLGMELAAHGIASAPVGVEDCEQEHSLTATNGELWSYHMSVGVVRDGKLALIDPVFAGGFLTVDQWLSSMGAGEVNVAVGLDALDSVSGCNRRPEGVVDVPTRVEDMPPWHFENVMIYCSYMRTYLRTIEGENSARETALIQRIHELTIATDDLGLIDAGDAALLARVRKEPYCPPPIRDK